MDSIVTHTFPQKRSSLGSCSGISPSPSMFSRGHSSRSSVSSAASTSSPLPARDSFDIYGSAKRLEDVREEPQEREEEWMTNNHHAVSIVNEISNKQSSFSNKPENLTIMTYGTSPPISPLQMEYSLGDHDAWSMTSSGHHHFKRQRSQDHRHSLTDRVASRFGSISRRWKTRSSLEPQLSIITPGPVAQRSSSAASSHIISPALSAISQHEARLSAISIPPNIDDTLRESAVVPLIIDQEATPTYGEQEYDQGQATTPLLPPTVADLSSERHGPIQSPLQSPSIAATPCIAGSRMSMDNAAATLPSPPLSTRPSMASIRRGRCESSALALPSDIPPLTLHEEANDPWDGRLGHANFSIHPEPYEPDVITINSYREFRANWALARKQYAQHITRTTEHYGGTSRVYKLTQEKWNEIDDAWTKQDMIMSHMLSRDLARLSDDDVGSPTSAGSPNVLDKPLTRIIVPALDQSGKFPEMGDADIVGPLATAPAKAPELQRLSPDTPPSSPRKRTLFKYLSDCLARHSAVR